MKKQIEVEYIGKINKEKFNELKILFEKDGKFLKRKERISFMYFRDEIPEDISEIKEEDTDLRLRITNKKPELIIKKGLFTGTHSRREISIIFDKKNLSNYVDFLSALGWDKGVIYAVETFVYEYEGIEFSLVGIIDYGFNFEAEILTTKNEQNNAIKKIKKILNKLSLVAFDEEGLNKQCNEINNRTKLRFDFSNGNIKEYLERFPRFF
tara:strand:- start:195 stop:824 length:630 start_codon:yes stop_codon:yes gene_type:complete